MMESWKRCGRKQVWPVLRYYSAICMEHQRKKELVRIASWDSK